MAGSNRFGRASALLLFVGTIAAVEAADPVTVVVYNSGFALVRQPLELELRAGDNDVRTSAVPQNLDPASVILRDLSGKAEWRIIEQKFRAQPLSERDMLARFEGQTIPFRWSGENAMRDIQGKIVRAGASGHSDSDPIIEVDGKIQFEKPGTPIFPALPENVILKPELFWRITSPAPLKTQAELSYITEAIDWTADYNAILKDENRIFELTAWVTLKNETRTSFPPAEVKLIAGDIKRLSKGEDAGNATTERVIVTGSYIPGAAASVQTRTFDEYHEFTLPKPVVLTAAETTQVELVRANDVTLTRSFVYDGANLSLDTIYDAQLDAAFGTDSTSKVLITTEFKNDEANHLGLPLPKGRLHFYRHDADGRLQFTGDSAIDNTPRGEMVRAVTGNAFDLVGERRQTDFRLDEQKRTAEESFEIKLRNQRKEAVEVRVIEHPARWRQWEITAQTIPAKKVDARTIEFRLPVKAGQESSLTYTIRYSQFPRPRG